MLMSDNCFFDSNISIYLFDNNEQKKEAVIELVVQRPLISSQVIIECLNISIKKLKISKEVCFKNAELLMENCEFCMITIQTLKKSFEVAKRFQYSHLDSLIIATALEANCSILYSEDLQHGQIIDKKLKIINPFINRHLSK